MTLSTVAHDTFVIERTYNVPVTQVFGAWADPILKARWFAGSADALEAGYELDFRVGGREVNRGGRLGGPVYTYEMFADETRISVSVATIQFRSQDATTQLVLTEQGVFLDGHETVVQREEGTRILLDSLAAILNGGGS
jgi:uncharacterized protein YndB with AHSA1/START domain